MTALAAADQYGAMRFRRVGRASCLLRAKRFGRSLAAGRHLDRVDLERSSARRPVSSPEPIAGVRDAVARSAHDPADVQAELEEALTLWHGLVEGLWSLVDGFELDGRWCLVVRRAAPGGPDPRALTPRERELVGFVGLGYSNKFVAYGLGLTESAVSSHLSSAMRKLGLRCRCALVALMAALRDPEAARALQAIRSSSVGSGLPED